VEALTGQFDDHHAELARMLLEQIDQLTAQIARLTTRIEELIVAPGQYDRRTPSSVCRAPMPSILRTEIKDQLFE